jgi:hypothetical protein
MDELSGFAGAPKDLGQLEAKLFHKADLVFTGGRENAQSYERHSSSYPLWTICLTHPLFVFGNPRFSSVLILGAER